MEEEIKGRRGRKEKQKGKKGGIRRFQSFLTFLRDDLENDLNIYNSPKLNSFLYLLPPFAPL